MKLYIFLGVSADMSTSLLEELEKLLRETNDEKQRLNFICETVWDLLNPPGTEKNGLFKIEKKVMPTTQQVVTVCEETMDMSSALGDSLESVTKLIAMGKLVRDSTKFEKKKRVNPSSDVRHTSLPWKEKLETVTQVACNKRVSSCKGLSKEVKSGNSVKQNVKKTDSLPYKTSASLKNNLLSRPDKIENKVSSDFTSHKKNSPDVSLNTDCNSTHPKGYSHLCSNSLSNLVKTLKMPEDLRCVLKHQYYFEKHKENFTSLENSPKPSIQTFRGRFQNAVSVMSKPKQYLYLIVMSVRGGA